MRANTATAARASRSEPTSSTGTGASPAATPAPARDASVCVMRRRYVERGCSGDVGSNETDRHGSFSPTKPPVAGSAQAPLRLAEAGAVHLSRADGVAELRVAQTDGCGTAAGHVEGVPDGFHRPLDRRRGLGGDDRGQLRRPGVQLVA